MNSAETATNRKESIEIERRIIAPKLAMIMTGLSRVTLWRLSRSGDFPRPVQISPGRVGYFAEDIEAWLLSKRQSA